MAYFSANTNQGWYRARPETVVPQGPHHCPHCDAACPYARPPNANRPQAPRPAAHRQQAGPPPAPQTHPIYYGTIPEGYDQPQPSYLAPNAPCFQGPPPRGPPAEYNAIPFFLTRVRDPPVPTVDFHVTGDLHMRVPAPIYDGPDGAPVAVELFDDARLVRAGYHSGRTRLCLARLNPRPRQRPQGLHADLGIDTQGNFSAPVPPAHGPRRARMERSVQTTQSPERRHREAARRHHQRTEEQQGETSRTQRDD